MTSSRLRTLPTLAAAALFVVTGCGEGGTDNSSVEEVIALIDTDAGELCASKPGAKEVWLEAKHTACPDEPCVGSKTGTAKACGAGDGGDVKVRLGVAGTYVLELVTWFEDGSEERDCYAPSAQDEVEVPASIDMTVIVILEKRYAGPCQP